MACAIAETITLPTDVAKTRLQVQSSASNVQYRGMIDCLRKTAQSEGISACWKGLQPALLRQVCYGSLSLVLYEPIRKQVCKSNKEGENPTFLQRLFSGGAAGAISITVFNPTEVIKTQIQTSTSNQTIRSVVGKVLDEAGYYHFGVDCPPILLVHFWSTPQSLEPTTRRKVK